MKSADVIDVLTSALKGDRERLLSGIRRMESNEAAANNHGVARSLGYLLRNYGCERGTMIQLPNAWHGLTALAPKKTLNDLVLADSVRQQLSELSEEHKKRELLDKHGLRPRNRLLLHGPPGNGKTVAAESLATMLDMPFLFVNHHDLIDSHLGESCKNLSSAMKSAANQPCVLFIDEMDAVGQARGSDGNSAGKEANRIVSSLLMQLDAMPQSVTFVAATNAIDLLDHALLRRFDSKIEFLPPTASQVSSYLSVLKGRHPVLAEQRIDEVELVGLSYAEIETRLMNLARTILIAL